MVIKQLSERLDPVGLMSWIAKKTRYGKKPGPDAWIHTRAFLADYGKEDETDDIVRIFGLVGVTDEVDAQVWIAEHLDDIE